METTELVTIEPTSEEQHSLQTSEKRKRRFQTELIRQQQGRELRLKDFLLKKRDYFRNLDKEARLKHLQDVDQMIRYFNGDQYGGYDIATGVYQPYARQDGDYAYTIPVLTGHVEQAFMMLLKTNIEYHFTAKNENEPNSVALAKMCEQLAVEEKARLMDEEARMDEIINSILAGQSYRCLLWAVNPESPKTIQKPQYDEKKNHTGTRDVPVGENILHIPHPVSVSRDLSASRIKHSTFILEEDSLPKHIAQWMYQSVLQDTQGLTEAMRVKREQERASVQTDAIVGSAGANNTQSAAIIGRSHLWMDVGEYGHFVCEVDEELPDGEILKAGTILGDARPEGLYVCYVGDEIMRFRRVNKNREWSEVKYGKRPGTSRGMGLQHLIPLQDIVNDDFNLGYAIKMTSARPLTALWRKAIKTLPEAGQFLFIDQLPPNQGMDGAIRQYPGQTMANDGSAERVEAAMQFIGGTMTLQGNYGAPDNRIVGTATGVAAAQENASGRMIGPVKQLIFADKELMFQILENIRDYSEDEQKKELEQRFGPDIVKYFFECNFRQKMNITVAPNTDIPRSMALTQANMMAFGQLASSLMTLEVPWAMEVVSLIADALGITFNVGPGRTDRREAEYRLNKLVAIEEEVKRVDPQYLTNVQAAAEKMFLLLAKFCHPLVQVGDPSGIFMQDHNAFRDVYKDWLFGEKSKTASPAMKFVVIQLWMEHFKAEAAQQFEMAKLQAELQETMAPPVPEGPSPEEMAAQQQGDDQKELARFALEKEAEEEQEDAKLERELVKAGYEADLQAQAQAQANQGKQSEA